MKARVSSGKNSFKFNIYTFIRCSFVAVINSFFTGWQKMKNVITTRFCVNVWSFKSIYNDCLLAVAQEITKFDTDAGLGKIRFTHKEGSKKAGQIEYCATFAECQGKADLIESVNKSPLRQVKSYHILN